MAISTLARTTAKATVTSLSAPPSWVPGRMEKGSAARRAGEQHDALNAVPTGVRYIDSGGQPFQSVSREPASTRRPVRRRSARLQATRSRSAIDSPSTPGIRFDHTRAISPDVTARDVSMATRPAQSFRVSARSTRGTCGRLDWGLTAKLAADGRTMLRASYRQISPGRLDRRARGLIHPGQTPVTTMAFDAVAGGYTRLVSIRRQQSRSGQLDPATRTPRGPIEYSIGDRSRGRAARSHAAVAYVAKERRRFSSDGSTRAGMYREETRTLPDGQVLPVFVLTNGTSQPTISA